MQKEETDVVDAILKYGNSMMKLHDKLKELWDVFDELFECGKVFLHATEKFKTILDDEGSGTHKKTTKKKATPVQAEEPKQIEEKEATLTKEDVRRVLATKSAEGKQAEIRALLAENGASNLTELDPSKYDAVVKAAEAL